MVAPTTATTNNERTAQSFVTEGSIQLGETKKVRTRGWELFDFFVHGVNGLGLNVVFSMLIANDEWRYIRNQAILDGSYKGVEQKNPVMDAFHGFNHKIQTGVSDWKGWNALVNKRTGDAYFKDQAIGITNSVLTLSYGGHISTAIAAIMERPAIKTRAVRFLDNVIDGTRRLAGKQVNDNELAERQQIYHKLDTEFSGKSPWGMISSRIVGIGMVIASMVGLAAADRGLNPTGDDNVRGFQHAAKFFFDQSKAVKDRPGSKFDPAYLKPPAPGEFVLKSKVEGKPEFTKAQYLARMASLELVGSTITQVVQYSYLMAKEFFGIGANTNVSHKSVEANATPRRKSSLQAEATKASPAEKPRKSPTVEPRKSTYTAQREQEREITGELGIG